MIHFPFAEYWWLYFIFLILIFSVIFFDLGFLRKKEGKVSVKESFFWTLFWIVAALAFNTALYFYIHSSTGSPEIAKRLSLEFLTGFIVEKVLAVDNIFVFALVFSAFSIPEKYQHRVLFWGILGAVVFRSIFISISSVLMQYHWVVIFFGVLLIVTGIKFFLANDKNEDLNNSFIVKILKRFIPVTTSIDSNSFMVYKNGKRYATPLFVALIFIEVSDIIFAVDSVPVIFALTNEPLIVFTSNIFAMMGLRSLYFIFADVIKRFHYIKYGMATIIIFIGLKMAWLNSQFNGKFPIEWSLFIIVTILMVTISISFIKAKYRELRDIFKRNFHIKDTNEALARGAAVGFFFGVSLFWGLQIAGALFFSHLIKGNKVISASFTFLSNPITTIPLYTICYFVGHLLIGGKSEIDDVKELLDWGTFLSHGDRFIIAMLLGTTIVGVVGGTVTYLAIKLLKRKSV